LFSTRASTACRAFPKGFDSDAGPARDPATDPGSHRHQDGSSAVICPSSGPVCPAPAAQLSPPFGPLRAVAGRLRAPGAGARSGCHCPRNIRPRIRGFSERGGHPALSSTVCSWPSEGSSATRRVSGCSDAGTPSPVSPVYGLVLKSPPAPTATVCPPLLCILELARAQEEVEPQP
jgi:hypothetical protein